MSLWESRRGGSRLVSLWRKHLAPYLCTQAGDQNQHVAASRGRTKQINLVVKDVKDQKKKTQPKILTKTQCSGTHYGTACLADLALVSYSFKRQSLPWLTLWGVGVTVVPCVTPGEPWPWQHHPCARTVIATKTWLPLLAKGQEIQPSESLCPAVPCRWIATSRWGTALCVPF